MSVSSIPASTSPVQTQQAAHAKFLRTGIDKDAAAGDPDHDGSKTAAASTGANTPNASGKGSRVNILA